MSVRSRQRAMAEHAEQRAEAHADAEHTETEVDDLSRDGAAKMSGRFGEGGERLLGVFDDVHA